MKFFLFVIVCLLISELLRRQEHNHTSSSQQQRRRKVKNEFRKLRHREQHPEQYRAVRNKFGGIKFWTRKW